MLAFLGLFYEILFGGYATPTKCVAFWRLALNSYKKLSLEKNMKKARIKRYVCTSYVNQLCWKNHRNL